MSAMNQLWISNFALQGAHKAMICLGCTTCFIYGSCQSYRLVSSFIIAGCQHFCQTPGFPWDWLLLHLPEDHRWGCLITWRDHRPYMSSCLTWASQWVHKIVLQFSIRPWVSGSHWITERSLDRFFPVYWPIRWKSVEFKVFISSTACCSALKWWNSICGFQQQLVVWVPRLYWGMTKAD